MNRLCSSLDRFKLVSNSDAHSPEKLGREANLFDAEISYSGILEALRGKEGFLGTIEFFPQEGKYHYDGHRKCDICWDPLETIHHHGLCPVCGKPVTRGVMYRVAELADRNNLDEYKDSMHYYSITQLPDILAEVLHQKSNSGKTVQNHYFNLINSLGSEFNILLFADLGDIEKAGGEILAEAINRLRNGDVIIDEGYDGEFGRIRLFNKDEAPSMDGSTLFDPISSHPRSHDRKSGYSIRFDVNAFQQFRAVQGIHTDPTSFKELPPAGANRLTDEQEQAIAYDGGPCMILAGPGSGKTMILTERIRFLAERKKVLPENIMALTFSNRAAEEIRTRIGGSQQFAGVLVSTFHAFGLSVLRDYFDRIGREINFYIADDDEIRELFSDSIPG